MNVDALRPAVCVLPDGRIGIFIGAAYRYLPIANARELLDKLTCAVQASEARAS